MAIELTLRESLERKIRDARLQLACATNEATSSPDFIRRIDARKRRDQLAKRLRRYEQQARKAMLTVVIVIAVSVSASAQALRTLDYAPLVAAGSLDIYSTVRSPGREQNPTINWIRHEPTMLATGAGLEAAAFAIAHRTIGRKRPKLVRAAILTATAIHLFAAVNNLQNPRSPYGR